MPPIFSREITQPVVLGDSLGMQFRTSPCEHGCPAGNSIQKAGALVEKGEFGEALRYLLAKNPFPGITGRVCPHFCQNACNRGGFDEVVNIRGIERAVADHAPRGLSFFKNRPLTGRSVGIVGGGPAGLTAARFLVQLGHEATVYEAGPVLGGMPRYGVPDFRLPREVTDREVGRILECGVHARVNTCVGRDISWEDVRGAHDAVLLATGTRLEKTMPIPGAELAVKGASFLHDVTLGSRPRPGRRVVVIGGGGTACDCASTAVRLGAEQTSIFYRRGEKDMSATPEELALCRADGVEIRTCRVVTEILSESGSVTGVRCHDVTDCVKDADGSVACTDIPGSEQVVACDTVVFAIGMAADLSFLGDGLPECSKQGLPVVDASFMTSFTGVFAAGDIASGPASIAQAVGQGRRAAFAVHAFLTGESARVWILDEDGVLQPRDDMASDADPHVVGITEIDGIMKYDHCGSVTQRNVVKKDFTESVSGYSPDEAMAEAARCMHCGHCKNCGECVASCAGLILGKKEDGPCINYPDECWHCGCCRLACPGGCIAFRFPIHTML